MIKIVRICKYRSFFFICDNVVRDKNFLLEFFILVILSFFKFRVLIELLLVFFFKRNFEVVILILL